MAMERYVQDTLEQDNFNKEDDASLNKWKSSSESIDESENCSSGGFDCNICLDTVNDPVVTLCGHLYCWPCIYKWIHHQKNPPEYPKSVQCPVCKSDVSQKTLIPLYGRGQTAEPLSDKKDDIAIPHRPVSPRCNVPAQQLNHRHYQHAPMPMAVSGLGGMTMTNMINPTSPTTGILGEIVYERIFGNSHSTLFAYPNSYNLAGISTQRARRQAMQADRSLSRICFFLLCCIILCLLLF
ncbi:putative transcription factor C2H2 family [Helianthus annuus]|nr:putative transcription factor C2H2 family [Helianthus annuus]KAJ0631560.1 putative transcription factor C2H2 family [Helianthus annuus]